MSLLSELRTWRNNQARIEGAEQYRVLSNAVLDALVGALPRNKEEMLAIKGIKEAKYARYGAVLLRMIAEESGKGKTPSVFNNNEEARGQRPEVTKTITETNHGEASPLSTEGGEEIGSEQPLSVGQFLDGLNIELSGMAARVQGEVSSVDVRERVVYFTLKDALDDSTLNCLIFRNQYTISGVDLAMGDEIIVEGAPDIYKPSGRLSLKVGLIELCGEGALKKAYDALKLKLEQEGLFAPEKKRALPEFPTRIALITSEQGAAIGDFTMNLGSQGLHVSFYPTSVEGKRAVPEILRALRYFEARAENYDVLVLVRGGGSLESLQAFNNEALVRAVAHCPIPTLLGVGHEKDITLAALVADVMVSTPTATARTLRAPRDEARGLLRHFEQHLPMLLERELVSVRSVLTLQSEGLLSQLRRVLEMADFLRQNLAERLVMLQSVVQQRLMNLVLVKKAFEQHFLTRLEGAKKELVYAEDLLRQYDPTRVLRLGYSLVRSGRGIVKDVSWLKVGDILKIQLSQGGATTRVEEVSDN